MRALGLMSGTSMDGIDIALLDTDGHAALERGPAGFAPYDEATRALLREAVAEALPLEDRGARPPRLAAAEDRLTALHGAAIDQFLQREALDRRSIDIVGFHGQTVLHRPERRLTIQIGRGDVLAQSCGIDVVADFRAADVAAGGQGAPLVPVFHRALAEAAGLDFPVVLLNIGGVANITYLAGRGIDPLACDTGPGNALLDDLMLERTGTPFDPEGRTAASGRCDPAILAQLLDHPYFAAPAPKSLDRNAWSRGPVADLPLEDAAATLTAFTAASIAKAVRALLPSPPTRVIVCGGGARNATLMHELGARLPCRLQDAGAFGWSGDAIEAQAFAYLAVRSRLGLPLTFPTTTGVAAPLSGGVTFLAPT